MSSYFNLSGKTAVVTGAGQGLGLAIACRLAAAGARICIFDLNAKNCESAVQTIRIAGGDAFAISGDVSDELAVNVLFEQIEAKFGGVDILVNNAGIAKAEDIFEMTVESWRTVIDVNLLGALLCSKAALTQMRKRGRGGRIIMMSSMVAHQGAVKGWAHYGASKSGLLGLAKTLARTGAAFNVTVNSVAPGIIDTDLLRTSHGLEGTNVLLQSVPLSRLGTSEDVAAAVHFLASEEAGYITGATIDITGGMYMRA